MPLNIASRKYNIYENLQGSLIALALLGIATAVSALFYILKIEEANMVMIYMLAVTGIAYFTRGYLVSTIASVVAVLLFNFFFTAPRFSLFIFNSSSVFTVMTMLLSALMMSSMTNKMQKAMVLAKSRERRTQLLFHISQRLIRIERVEDVASVIGEECSSILHRRILVGISRNYNQLDEFLHFHRGAQIEHFPALAAHHFSSMNSVFQRRLSEIVTPKFKGDSNIYYVPVLGKRKNFGIIGFVLKDDEMINEEHSELGLAIAAMMSNAFEHFSSNHQ